MNHPGLRYDAETYNACSNACLSMSATDSARTGPVMKRAIEYARKLIGIMPPATNGIIYLALIQILNTLTERMLEHAGASEANEYAPHVRVM